jgi:hypothetical protein
MKIPRNPSLRSAYLYADGHLVEWYEAPVAGADLKVEFAIIREAFVSNAYFKGRLVINDYNSWLLPLFEGGTVEYKEPTAERGSDNTQKAGLRIGYLSWWGGKNVERRGSITVLDPSLISPPATSQPETNETFASVADAGYWGDVQVLSVIRKSAPKTEEVPA